MRIYNEITIEKCEKSMYVCVRWCDEPRSALYINFARVCPDFASQRFVYAITSADRTAICRVNTTS